MVVMASSPTLMFSIYKPDPDIRWVILTLFIGDIIRDNENRKIHPQIKQPLQGASRISPIYFFAFAKIKKGRGLLPPAFYS